MPNKVIFINRPQRIGNTPAEFEVRVDRRSIGSLLVSKEGLVWQGADGALRFNWEEFADFARMTGTEGGFIAAIGDRSPLADEDDT